MPLTAYVPLDLERYRRHNDSVRFSPTLRSGAYVYVQDCAGIVWTLPDGPHRHPRVLGGARPAVSAGELVLAGGGLVLSVNNLSGTFRCAADSLLVAIGGLVKQGATVPVDAIEGFEV